jgi:2'-deoxynucleoside 5'-phosphate N-hydrolase
MVKVFFGCSMRGGYSVISKKDLTKFPDIIKELGCKLTSRHQTQNWVETEAKLTKTDIHDRDYQWEIESDCGIFEISNPSLGVGGEISDMISLGKPVLCLFKKGLGEKVSAYTQGKDGSKYVKTPFECHNYESLDQVKIIIQKFINKYCQINN